MDRWVDDVVERRGRIDLLVNNAGVIDTRCRCGDSDPDEWWHTIEVNVRGPYLMTPRGPATPRRDRVGRIVNINSAAAYRNHDVATAYNVSKGALARITAAVGL